MNDALTADAIDRLRNTFNDWQESPLLSPRDQFALAIVSATNVEGSHELRQYKSDRAAFAKLVYDIAEALNEERRKRNAEDGK